MDREFFVSGAISFVLSVAAVYLAPSYFPPSREVLALTYLACVGWWLSRR